MDASNGNPDSAHHGSRYGQVIVITFTVAVALHSWRPVVWGCDEDAGAAPGASAATSPVGAGGTGMRVHIDPATGTFVPPPAGEADTPAAVVGPAPAGPVRQEPVPGGGFKVETRRRVLQSTEGSD